MDDLNNLHDLILDTKAKITRLAEFQISIHPDNDLVNKATKHIAAFNRSVTNGLADAERAVLGAL